MWQYLLENVCLLQICTWSCHNLCDPVDCRPPGSFVHGISQARLLEWVVFFSSRGPSWPRDLTHLLHLQTGVWWVLIHLSGVLIGRQPYKDKDTRRRPCEDRGRDESDKPRDARSCQSSPELTENSDSPSESSAGTKLPNSWLKPTDTLDSHKHSMGWTHLQSLLHRCIKGGSEKLRNLAKVTQLMSEGTEIQRQVSLVWNPSSLPLPPSSWCSSSRNYLLL